MIDELKNNQRAFTLVELLVTIAIIGFLAASMTVAAFSMWQRQVDNYNEEIISNLEEAACVYAGIYLEDSSTYEEVKIADLISSGLIDPDIKDILLSIEGINATGDDLEYDYVTVKWVDGEKTCIYEGLIE